MDTTNDLLGELIAKKDDINSRPILPGGSLILSDLQSLNQSFIVSFTRYMPPLGTRIKLYCCRNIFA